MSWVRRFGEDRRSQRTGWVEDNIFVVLGLARAKRVRRDPATRPLRSADGRMLFQPLQARLESGYESHLRPFRVSRPKGNQESTSLGFGPLEEVPCEGGAVIVVHTFRPQRPRASASTGIRSGVAECKVTYPPAAEY
eukprot:216863-Hanusia_phi.AAC.1